MKSILVNFSYKLEKLKALPLFFLRLVLAYGFFDPEVKKIQDLNAIAE